MYVTGFPRFLLRLEGLVVLLLSLHLYNELGEGWLLFVLLFFAPDISMLGYLAGPGSGAVIYNLGHTYLFPAGLALLGYMLGQPFLYSLALIWSAHIGFDRLIGYGLKYNASFQKTHLGRIGRKPQEEEVVGQ